MLGCSWLLYLWYIVPIWVNFKGAKTRVFKPKTQNACSVNFFKCVLYKSAFFSSKDFHVLAWQLWAVVAKRTNMFSQNKNITVGGFLFFLNCPWFFLLLYAAMLWHLVFFFFFCVAFSLLYFFFLLTSYISNLKKKKKRFWIR